MQSYALDGGSPPTAGITSKIANVSKVPHCRHRVQLNPDLPDGFRQMTALSPV